MPSMIDRYFDLLASGDKDRIRCVLQASGAVIGGVGLGLAFAPANAAPAVGQAINATAAAVGAVLGLIVGANSSMAVRGAGTEGSFDNLFKAGSADDQVSRARTRLQADGHFTLAEADALIDVAIVAAKLGRTRTSPWSAQHAKYLRPLLTHLKGANYSGLAAG